MYSSVNKSDKSATPRKHKLQALKNGKTKGKKFTMLTSYDATFARVVDEQGIEVILVGDSLGMVVHGRANTSLVTLADMEFHTEMVSRGVNNALLMADIPMACAGDNRIALESALRLMRAGAEMVKFETNPSMIPVLQNLSRQGIPFCAHLGLLPQQALKEGGYKVKGREADKSEELLNLAKDAEEAGADMLLLECVVGELASKISKQAKVPVVGIGCGGGTDAQVLVIYDMLGLNPKPPRFVKNFMQEADSIGEAIALFRHQVLKGEFPAAEHSYD